MEEINVSRTKSGNGLKIRVGDAWLFTSVAGMQRLLKGESSYVKFGKMPDSQEQTTPAPTPEQAQEIMEVERNCYGQHGMSCQECGEIVLQAHDVRALCEGC